jgi:hypothetical protein
MKFLKILLLTILLVAFTACNIPQPAVGRHIVLITPNPNATATPTPFLPFSFTPTVTSDQPVPATQEPVANTPEGPLPTPIGGRPLGQKLILILGSDYRPDSGFRTDVILLVAVNPYDGTVKMLSFPRDLYIEIPG